MHGARSSGAKSPRIAGISIWSWWIFSSPMAITCGFVASPSIRPSSTWRFTITTSKPTAEELFIPLMASARVYFAATKFGHVFYESTARDGLKDHFSPVRAQRIDWIKATLEHPQATLFEGWNSKARQYDASRRVAVVYPRRATSAGGAAPPARPRQQRGGHRTQPGRHQDRRLDRRPPPVGGCTHDRDTWICAE